MDNWQDCIVSHFDLIGIKKLIVSGDKKATHTMRLFHTLVYKRINCDMPAHQNVYVWNDSATFLSCPKNIRDYKTIMSELNALKPLVDDICPCYAICIKGQIIPEPACGYGTETNGQPRFVFIKASSYAFANCFEVEKELCKKRGLKTDWYVDSRIARKISSFPKGKRYYVNMLPSGRKRFIHVHRGLLW